MSEIGCRFRGHASWTDKAQAEYVAADVARMEGGVWTAEHCAMGPHDPDHWHALETVEKGSRTCPGSDPTCPCQDGLLCHYEGPNAWPIPDAKGSSQVTAPASTSVSDD